MTLLLPCPFCGREPPEDLIDTLYPSGTIWRQHEEGFRCYYPSRYRSQQECDGQCWVMHCSKHEGGCGAEMHGDSREEVIAAWNQRVIKCEGTG